MSWSGDGERAKTYHEGGSTRNVGSGANGGGSDDDGTDGEERRRWKKGGSSEGEGGERNWCSRRDSDAVDRGAVHAHAWTRVVKATVPE